MSPKLKGLLPYTPGEQPKEGGFIKLNTNESPYPPSPAVIEALEGKAETLRLYPDPECRELNSAIADAFGLDTDEVITGNGSDELLAFIFQAFCSKGAAFPTLPTALQGLAQLYGINTRVLPLKDDFSICLDDYTDIDETIFIANPNAPTGLALPASDIIALAKNKADRLIVVDEAYVDFGAEAVPYIKELDNLIVVQTFSKSRNLAGGVSPLLLQTAS